MSPKNCMKGSAYLCFLRKKPLLKSIFLFICIFFFNACGSGGCEDLNDDKCTVLKDFVVFDSTHPLNFNHLCSEVDYQFSASWQSYAFFEKSQLSEKYKVLILAEVSVGWIRGPMGPNGINIRMEKFQIENFFEWAGESFSLALQVTNLRTGKSVTGDFSEIFSFSRPGGFDGGTSRYALFEDGSFYWEKFIEPEEQKDSQENIYYHTEDIQVIAENIPHPEDSQSLAIVLQNSKTQSQLVLKGPVLNDLKSRLQIENPKPQTLGFLQTINPFQKGGLWDVLQTGYRYRNCIYLRKKAKKEFDIRFSR